jgi:hypothetical protein
LNVGVTGGADDTYIKNILFDIFMKRQIFRLSAAEQVGIYFGPLIFAFGRLCCRKSKVMHRIQTNHIMFRNAKQRYEREMDMIKLLKSVRDSENFRKMFLSRS